MTALKPKAVRNLQLRRPTAEHPRTLADHLRKRRIELGLTQPELARVLSASVSAVVDWEYGDTLPLPKHWCSLAELLECDLSAVRALVEVGKLKAER